jgi:hypothetical protein
MLDIQAANHRNATLPLILGDSAQQMSAFSFNPHARDQGPSDGLFSEVGETPAEQYRKQHEGINKELARSSQERFDLARRPIGDVLDIASLRSTLDDAIDTTGAPRSWSLPAGHNVSNVSFPSPDGKLAEAIAESRRDIAITFGVPLGLVVQEHAVRQDANANAKQLQETASVYDEDIGNVVTFVLEHILSRIKTKRNKHVSVNVSFKDPIPESTQLMEWLDRGIISHTAIAKIIEDMYGIPLDTQTNAAAE